MSLRKAIEEVLENEKKLDKEFSKLSNKAQTHANNLMRQGAESGDAIARAKKHYNEETVEEAVVESLDSPAVTTATAVKTGTGVTAEPCPAEIGGVPTGADQNKGCIYLGVWNDYTVPYAPAGPGLELAQRAFWLLANGAGGIGLGMKHYTALKDTE